MEARPSVAAAPKAAKKFQCSFPGCEKTFSRKSNMRAHSRVHTGEMPYSCPYCDKRFKWRSCQSSHEKIHKQPGFDAYKSVDTGSAFDGVEYERQYQGQGEAACWDATVDFGQGQHQHQHQQHQYQQPQHQQPQQQHQAHHQELQERQNQEAHQPHHQHHQNQQPGQPDQPHHQQSNPCAFQNPSCDPPAQQNWYPIRREQSQQPQSTDQQQAQNDLRNAPSCSPPGYDAQMRGGPQPNSHSYAELNMQFQQSSMASARAHATQPREQSLALRRAEMAAGTEAEENASALAVKSGANALSLASSGDKMLTDAFHREHFQSQSLGHQAHADERHNSKPVRAKQPSDNVNDALDAFYGRSFPPHQRRLAKSEETLYSAEGDGGFEVSPARATTGSTKGEFGEKLPFYDADREAHDAHQQNMSMNERGDGKQSQPASQSLPQDGSGFPAISPIDTGMFSNSRLPSGADGSPLKSANLELESHNAAPLDTSEGHTAQAEDMKLDGIPIDDFLYL